MRYLTYMLAIGALLFGAAPFAAEQTYQLRVDGLACPYCAYGIEKAFMERDGVEHVGIDFQQGQVIVHTERNVEFSEKQLRTIVNDAGFTLRGIKVVRSRDEGNP